MTEAGASSPQLIRRVTGEVAVWSDPGLECGGVVLAFSERGGGVSSAPYDTLNLAAHVGDDPVAVDENRSRLLRAMGLAGVRARLVTAEQVHGDRVVVVEERGVGSGAHARAGAPPVRASDALVTRVASAPLMLLFADCVPVVLVAPGPAIAIAHAGWRGALAGIAGKTATTLARVAGCETSLVKAYVGPHIGACHYEVGDEVMSQFVNVFGTFARADSGGLDLGRVVAASLTNAGVDPCNIATLGQCTAETTDRFFSYRAEAGMTGRHCALVCIR